MESELTFLISVLIICADISAGVLGIEAEFDQRKQQHHHDRQQHCRKPSSGAFAEGVAALVLLSIVHITANVLGGYAYIRSKHDIKRATANKILAVAFFVVSWIFFAVSYSTLMVGTLANSRSKRYCSLRSRWVFLIGGIFCLAHGPVTSAYYVSALSASKEDKENVQQEDPANRRGA